MRISITEKHSDGRVVEAGSDPSERDHYELPRGTSPTNTPDDVDPQAQFEAFRKFRESKLIMESKQHGQSTTKTKKKARKASGTA